MFENQTNPNLGVPGNNANFGVYGTAPNYFNYNGVQPQQSVFKNVLTDEQIDSLQKQQNNFSLALTNEDHFRAICNHRSKDGRSDTLIQLPDGSLQCTICGYTFKQVDPNLTSDEIIDMVNDVINVLQTSKLMFKDLPQDAASEYFNIIPLMEKIPKFFELAAKNMAKHEPNGFGYNNNSYNAINMLNQLTNVFGGGMGMGYGYNPNMNYNPNPGMMYQQPQGNPFGYPGAGNPMMGGYTPNFNQYQYTPNQQPQQTVTNNQQPQQQAAQQQPQANVTQNVQA
jgi:hypothetical protein